MHTPYKHRATKCRTRRTALDARGSRSEKFSVAFTVADGEFRVARFRRAHDERKSQCHGDTSTADTQENVIRNTPLRQLRSNERNAQSHRNRIQFDKHSFHSGCNLCKRLRDVLLRKENMQCAILPLRAQKRGNASHERPVRNPAEYCVDLLISISY